RRRAHDRRPLAPRARVAGRNRPGGDSPGGDAMSGVLVVGGGIAGQAVVEAIRDHDALAPVTLACAEPRLPYDRVALSTLLATGEELGSLRPASWYEDHRVDVQLGARVASLDLDRG